VTIQVRCVGSARVEGKRTEVFFWGGVAVMGVGGLCMWERSGKTLLKTATDMMRRLIGMPWGLGFRV
jgi:hypothetical protein